MHSTHHVSPRFSLVYPVTDPLIALLKPTTPCFNIYVAPLLFPGSRQEVACIVSIELTSSTSLDTKAKRPASSGFDQSLVTVGSVVVSKVMTWVELEERLGCVFLNHTSEVSIGLRTKKTSRLDQDSPDAPNPFTLGISLSSVKYYTIGE